MSVVLFVWKITQKAMKLESSPAHMSFTANVLIPGLAMYHRACPLCQCKVFPGYKRH